MVGALRRFALEKPVIFWSCAIGAVGPVMVLTVPSIRREYFGFKGIPELPLNYPIPNRPRNPPSGYED